MIEIYEAKKTKKVFRVRSGSSEIWICEDHLLTFDIVVLRSNKAECQSCKKEKAV